MDYRLRLYKNRWNFDRNVFQEAKECVSVEIDKTHCSYGDSRTDFVLGSLPPVRFCGRVFGQRNAGGRGRTSALGIVESGHGMA